MSEQSTNDVKTSKQIGEYVEVPHRAKHPKHNMESSQRQTERVERNN